MKKLFALCALSLTNMAAWGGFLTNYNEPNTNKLLNALASNNIHIVQLGDSHTAGDSMTDALRSNLQERYGNGGMGWAMPMYFSGQRLARYGYDNNQWTAISSRRNQNENYTLGGLIAKPNHTGSSLTIKPKGYEPTQTMTVSIRQAANDGELIGIDSDGNRFNITAPIKNGTWQRVSFDAKLPFTITAQGSVSGTAIGGWWGKSKTQTGAIVSALGINGAELSHWNRWNDTAWQNELGEIAPDLIILAYGTNEGYNSVSAERVQAVLSERIRQIRRAAPNAAIMIVSAPEALRSTGGGCGTRPSGLSAIQQIQQQTAQDEQTLFWDWQAAMGGSCSMMNWIRSGKAAKDGVHFTHKGYSELGNQLAEDIKALSYTTPNNKTIQPVPYINYRQLDSK